MTDNPRYPFRDLCPLCAASDLENRFVVAGFQIARCRACTFVFVREHLTVDDLRPFYEHTDDDYIYTDEANRVNLDFYFHRLRKLLERTGGPGRILDVGCSAGQFLDTVPAPWQAYGVEFSPVYAEMAQKKHPGRVQQGTLEDVDFGHRFDAITFMDVLDHSTDPLHELRVANRLLENGGRVAVKVHNIDCLYARFTGPNFYAIAPPYHLSYFSPKTVKLALEKTGFEVLESRFIGHRLALKTVPYRLSRGEKGFMYGLYRMLDRSPLGNLPIYKNLHDIVTVVAAKRRDA
jgi:SAM-dependent methyltransferase